MPSSPPLLQPAALALMLTVLAVTATGSSPARAAPLPTPIKEVSSPAGPVQAIAQPRFAWPLDGAPSVVRRFQPPPRPWLPGHRGVDLAGAPGDVVRAAGGGVVRFAGWVAGRPLVTIEHAGGLRTTYEPVDPVVRAGDQVTPRAAIGKLLAGHDACVVRACLHWGLRRGSVYLDPLALVAPSQVRLLPLSGRLDHEVSTAGDGEQVG